MTRFNCNFPGCSYTTNDRRLIDFHHVIPKEIDSSPNNKRTISFCKTHHSFIYVPESKHGQHSIQTEQSLIIKQVVGSTKGPVIIFLTTKNQEILLEMNTGVYTHGN